MVPSYANQSYRFLYFNVRGAGELCRLTLSLSGASWQDVRYPMGLASLGFSPGNDYRRDSVMGAFEVNMGSLPILQIMGPDEHGRPQVLDTLGQSHSIAKFVAMTHGLGGLEPLEQAKVDAVYEHCRDIKAAWFRARREKERKAARFSIAVKQHDTDNANKKDDDTPQSLRGYCQRLEKAIAATAPRSFISSSDSPWCLGGPNPTLADLAIYHLLATPSPSVVTGSVPSFMDGESVLVQQAYEDDCPRLAHCVAAVGELPAVQIWEKHRPETFT